MKFQMLKTGLFACAFCLAAGATIAQTPAIGRSWKSVATRMPEQWYGTDEAKAVAENVLLYQRDAGGWPKNTPMHKPLSDAEKAELLKQKSELGATLDNDATTTELKFLAKVYTQTGDERYRRAFDKGLNYIFAAQYDNGGWPQFYPLRQGYYTHITFNDDCMVNILNVLSDIFNRTGVYAFAETDENVARAKAAFDKGIDCILKTQIVKNGQKTVWCAQHDEVTLAPAKARAYELPSYSGGESVGIVLLLMKLPNPSPEIVRAVDGAVKWFEEHKIEGIRLETKEANGEYNRHIVSDPNAPAMWARFYDLETEKPFFCDRDGIKKATLAEIGYERRNGYGWYTTAPQRVLDAYPTWKASLK